VAVIAVRDQGPGIANEDRERVFERFYRMADHERVSGTGLGLPIARDLARAMGGELDVASVPGIGSSFVLVLPGPAGAVATDAMAAATAAALTVEAEHLHTLTLLRAGAAAGRAGLDGRPTDVDDEDDRPIGSGHDRPMDSPDEDLRGRPDRPGRRDPLPAEARR
jgi:hypothetical protein